MAANDVLYNEKEIYFFQQEVKRKIPKRCRKAPEELPEALRFAHPNPKVAAYLASKNREALKHQEQDPFGDGLGKKSLLPNINQSVTNIKNRLDSALSNDEDSQKYLFEDTKSTSYTILQQLAKYLYSYDDIADHVPKSLEYQLMSTWKELTNDVIYVQREWQTVEIKEQYFNSLRDTHSDDEDDDVLGGRTSVLDKSSKPKVKKISNRPLIPEIIEDDSKGDNRMPKRSDSRMSTQSVARSKLEVRAGGRASRDHRGSRISPNQPIYKPRKVAGLRSPNIRKGLHDDAYSNIAETPSDPRSTALVTISFSLKDKKGVIMDNNVEEVDRKKLQEEYEAFKELIKTVKQQQQDDLDEGKDKPVVVRYYGDHKKEVLLKYRKSPVKTDSPVLGKSGKIRIPIIGDDRNEGKQLIQATVHDGTSFVYYPSGKPAIMFSSAGYGRPGYYLVAYDDGNNPRMLACFTPCGKGVCFSNTSKNIRFLSTAKGGHLTDTEGSVIQRWKWPMGSVKLGTPVILQLNSHLVFRCYSQTSMAIVFNCQKETAKFPILPYTGAVEKEDNEQLLTGINFTSRAAKELMRIFAPKTKTKNRGKQKKVKAHIAEMQKLLEFPDKLQYEHESERDLARLQRKAKNLVDDWMEHYRVTIGLISPDISRMKDRPEFTDYRRKIQSARISERLDRDPASQRPVLDLATDRRIRAPSAPLARSCLKKVLSRTTPKDTARKSAVASVVKFDDEPHEIGDDDVSPTALAVLERLTQSAGKRSTRSTRTSLSSAPVSRQLTSLSHIDLSSVKVHCPIAIRQQLLGLERPSCRCSRHYIPQITDIEYDDFVSTEAPESQVIVISVISSLFPYVNSAEDMLEEIYMNQNRNRTKPCVQGRNDTYRIFQYDINTAAEGSHHTTPLLLTRHNVVPGMILMYMNGHLSFCDHIFNGYGNARRDFKKQVMKTRLQAMQGFALPRDFRFSPVKGKSGMRSAWGGEIGGTGVDHWGNPGMSVDSALMPIQRPLTSSTDEDRVDRLRENTNIQQVKGYEKYVDHSPSPVRYHILDMKRHFSAPGRRLQGTVT
ncbi:uncharacterized protein LOC143062443 isoform X4 [Mytilus galloprovincialis]|uniref:uncharacterized protein isoform X8 n=1 Tax=Mytilus edulis TaxID=6550 RepID=UPI0039F0ECEC